MVVWPSLLSAVILALTCLIEAKGAVTQTVWVAGVATTSVVLKDGLIQEFYVEVVADGSGGQTIYSSMSISPLGSQTVPPTRVTDCAVSLVYE